MEDVVKKLVSNGLASSQIEAIYANAVSSFAEVEAAVKRSSAVLCWEGYEGNALSEVIDQYSV